MIKVLQIGMTNNLGGIETFLMNYYKNIDRKKVQFDFINIYDKLYFEDEIKKMQGKVYKVRSYYKNPFRYIKELIGIIKQNNYEIIHCNMNSAVFLYPLIAAKIAKAKVIIAHSHNASNDKGLLKTLLHNINKRFIPLFANTYFACSKEAGEWFFSNRILKQKNKKYFIINNGIDIDKFKFNEEVRKRIRQKFNLEDKTMLIGHIGRFSKQKNHEFIINLIKEIHDENEIVKIWLIGEGEKKNEIENLVKENHIESHVKFLGIRQNVNELLQAIDVFILPSIYEGMPLVAVEAQISGAKCFLSDKITKEAKITNKTEYITINNGVQPWKYAILKCDYERNDKYHIDFSKYDIKLNVKELVKIYECLMGN